MLLTAQSLYIAFLDGIKKSYTGTVVPGVFERIWNQWAQPEWLKDNVSSDEGVELTQKQIDDLAILVNRWLFIPGVLPNLYQLPDGVTSINVDIDGTATNVVLPKYYRQLSTRFSLDYSSNIKQECSLTGISGLLQAHYMRSDQRSSNYGSIYRKPKDSLLYWQRTNKATIANGLITGIKEYIEMLTDETIGSNSYRMSLEYLTYPAEITIVPDSGSNLSENAKMEIVKLCVSMYLERVKDPRYQSFLMEQKIHQSNKL